MWIASPAGSGKTTLVDSYLVDRRLSGLWCLLHAGDSDPSEFFEHLAEVVAARFRRRGFKLPALTPEYLPGLSAFARRYFDRLYERLPQPLALVFDDYHLLLPQSPIHAVLADGLTRCPPKIRVFTISRHLPPPEFARARVNQGMVMIDWPDLRLTAAETAGLTRHITRKSAPAGRISDLHEHTDGWIAGVILLLRDAAHRRPVAPPSDSSSRRALFDFFAGEILRHLDPVEQSVLQRCALLEEVTGRQAEQLSGEKTAGRILEQLYLRHCFVDRRESSNPTYRLHALFRQFLCERHALVSSPEERLEAHRAAAKVLEADGLTEAAVEQYQCAQAWTDLARIILTQARDWVARGRYQPLAQSLDALPAPFFEQFPWLCYWRAVCRLPFDLPESRSWFERSFDLFAAEGSAVGLFLSWSGVVESYLHQWDDFSGLDRWIDWLEARLVNDASFPSPEVEMRVTLAMFMALVFRRPHHRQLPVWLGHLLLCVDSTSDLQLKVLGLFGAAFYAQWVGDLGKAAVLVERIKQVTRHSTVAPGLTLQRKVSEASYAWFTAAFDTAYREVDEGLSMAAETGAHLWDHRLLAQGAYAALSQGDLGKAGNYLASMSAITDPGRRLDVSHLHLLRAWEALQRQDLPVALEHARTATSLAVAMGTPFPEALCRQGTAHILHAMGRREDACAEVARMREIGQPMNSGYLEFLTNLIDADDLLRAGADPRKVHVRLQRAMTLGRERGFGNFPFWQPEVMGRLCAAALEAQIETEYVRSLAKNRSLAPGPQSSSVESWPWRYQIFALGRFRLLRDGEPVTFAGKIPRKPLDLLKMLGVEFGGIGRQALEDLLWPEAEGDRARHALETALYRLRRLLDAEAIECSDGRLRLNPARCWSDVRAFESLLGQIGAQLSADGDLDGITALVRRTAQLYTGPYLEGETLPWVTVQRERLHGQWCRQLDRLGQHLEHRNRWAEAADCYRLALAHPPVLAVFYHRLIAACELLGQAAEAEIVRRRLRREGSC